MKKIIYRICLICGERHKQSEMTRSDETAGRWICLDCFYDLHPEYDEDIF